MVTKKTAKKTPAKSVAKPVDVPTRGPGRGAVVVGDGPHKDALIAALKYAGSPTALVTFFGINKSSMTRIYRNGKVSAELVLKLARAARVKPYSLDPALYPNERWSVEPHKFEVSK